MSNLKDGGPAFARSGFTDRETDRAQQGMSLRDWFAGKALTGLLAVQPSDCTAQEFAKAAYEQADAMLNEREST